MNYKRSFILIDELLSFSIIINYLVKANLEMDCTVQCA